MQINYSTLQMDVATWQTEYVRHIRDTQGDFAADATEFDMNADPSLTLMWYMEDLRSGVRDGGDYDALLQEGGLKPTRVDQEIHR